ncbi:DUF1566 domain-containing protein [Thiobacillus sp.]|uniref:Lcl domain-containing protein n=1 Tax=Thiobacillus sp. TaxID=924 RepID=UPI0025E042A5|nr:DUF1566 domain-containing protein [Thiobacillus sp.]MBT9540386.1 DUF1566 domain-containing protein [Thiobacillus sp.]
MILSDLNRWGYTTLATKNNEKKRGGEMITRTVLFVGALMLAGTANAALHDRGSGLIYDDEQNITWLQDANYAKTSGYDANGVMVWNEAMVWASSLSYGGVSGWRLPTTTQPDSGCASQLAGGQGYGGGCTASELGHLFYLDLGGVDGQSIVTTHNANFNLFQNIQTEFYWSETEYNASQAWNFYMTNGYQYADNKFEPNSRYAWAVRDGDVAAIPEPETYVMFLAGLGLVAYRTFKR